MLTIFSSTTHNLLNLAKPPIDERENHEQTADILIGEECTSHLIKFSSHIYRPINQYNRGITTRVLRLLEAYKIKISLYAFQIQFRNSDIGLLKNKYFYLKKKGLYRRATEKSRKI